MGTQFSLGFQLYCSATCLWFHSKARRNYRLF